MKLHYAAASPFVRKVHMAAIELNLAERISLVETHVTPGKENDDYASQVNPLRKIPALETDTGMTLYDSTVICDYLNNLEGSNQLIPADGDERYHVLTGQALANGMMESAVLLRYETFLRPENMRWKLWIDDQWDKITQGLCWFEEHIPNNAKRIDYIALACTLGYLDLRFDAFMWRERFPELCAWHEEVAKSSAYQATST